MIQLLSVVQFPKARPLFQRLMKNQPMCTAVLDGIYPGKVYVDDLTQPRTALLTTHIESEANGIWCFLAGEPANEAFNQSINAAIFSRQIIAENTPVLFLTCDPDDWGGQMEAVLAPRPPIWFPRYHFISRRVGFDWRAALPSGFTAERMTDDLCQIPALQLPDDVAATLTKWQAMTDPRFKDFGFVTQHDAALLDRINAVLDVEGLQYTGQIRVRHLLEVIVRDIGPRLIAEKTNRSLAGMSIAAYYGCQCLRPYAVFDDPEAPRSMTPILEAAGAAVHRWDMGGKCCGASHMNTKMAVGMELVRSILAQAKGADAIVTVCPMCQMNLEAYQGKISKLSGENLAVSVLYLPQLLGLALGLSEQEVRLELNLALTAGFRQKLRHPELVTV